jgi:hypothetical protein
MNRVYITFQKLTRFVTNTKFISIQDIVGIVNDSPISLIEILNSKSRKVDNCGTPEVTV